MSRIAPRRWPPTRSTSLVARGARSANASVWLVLATLTGSGCEGTAPAKPSVAVRGGGNPLDASQSAPADAAAHVQLDAANLTRDAEPRWPAAEVELAAPYKQPSAPTTLVLTPTPQKLDLHMNVDTTASFGDEIDTLQRELSSGIIPKLRKRIDDVCFGVSRFADFPLVPFGSPGAPPSGDRAYVLLTPITNSLSRVIEAVGRLDQPLGHGGDVPEAGAESLYQIATGSGLRWKNQPLIASWDGAAAGGGGTLGGVGYRAQALRVLVHVTDAPSHTPAEYEARGLTGTHGMAQAIEALNALQIHAIAIVSAPCHVPDCADDPLYVELHDELAKLALATGSSMAPTRGGCPTGIAGKRVPPRDGVCPLLFDVDEDGSGLADTVVDSVVGLLAGVRFSEVHAEVGDDPLGFVRRIEASPVVQTEHLAQPQLADRLPKSAPDGVPETYLQVQQQHRLGFKVTLQNDRIAPSDVTQHFRVSIRLLGDGTLLEEHLLRVVIPAAQPSMHVADDAGQ